MKATDNKKAKAKKPTAEDFKRAYAPWTDKGDKAKKKG